MAYMVINRDTLAIHHFGGGLIEVALFGPNHEAGTDGYDEALSHRDTLGPEFEVVTTHEFNERLAKQRGKIDSLVKEVESLEADRWERIKQTANLREVIETYLNAGAEGNTELEEFIEQTEALAEAIGYEFTEEREFTARVTFTAKVKRSQAYFDSNDFGIEVESETDEAEVTGITEWRIFNN